jgi:hypothetical protein
MARYDSNSSRRGYTGCSVEKYGTVRQAQPEWHRTLAIVEFQGYPPRSVLPYQTIHHAPGDTFDFCPPCFPNASQQSNVLGLHTAEYHTCEAQAFPVELELQSTLVKMREQRLLAFQLTPQNRFVRSKRISRIHPLTNHSRASSHQICRRMTRSDPLGFCCEKRNICGSSICDNRPFRKERDARRIDHKLGWSMYGSSLV